MRIALPSTSHETHRARILDAARAGAYEPRLDVLSDRLLDVLFGKGAFGDAPVFSAPAPSIPSILLVEDNDDDAAFVERALQRSALVNRVLRMHDGEACLDYVASCAAHELPVAVLLDLRLPKIDGLGVLSSLRDNAHSARLPVIVTTSSSHDEDLTASTSLRIDAFLRKPVRAMTLLGALEHAGVRIENLDAQHA